MPDFNSITELEAYLQNQIKDALKNEVADTVSNVILEEIDNVVYNAYSPTTYSRRYVNDGLADPSNIKVTPIEDGISVSNVAMTDDGYTRLDGIICSGEGYTYAGYGYDYEQPRDFYKSTVDRLELSGEHIEALKEALRKHGITVE